MTPTLALESILIFSVGTNHFCAAMQRIKSVLDYQPLSTLPNTPAYVAGGFWYLGDFTRVINVRKKFALPDRDKPKSGSFITTRIDNELLAFWVDRIENVTDASNYRWQKLPALNTGVFSRALFRNQQIVLEVDFEKLKNTDSLNVVDIVKTLSLSNPATKQSGNTETIKTQAPLRLHSEARTIDNSTTSPQKRKKLASTTPLLEAEAKTTTKKKPATGTITGSTPSKTTTTLKTINQQTIKNDNAEKTTPAKRENTDTKTNNNTRDIDKPMQTATQHTTANEYKNIDLNIAPLLLLVSMISALLFFTFGTYLEKNLKKFFFQSPAETLIKTLIKKNTDDKLKKQDKAITTGTQDHQIAIQRQQRSTTLTTSPATQNTLGNKPDNNIIFIHTVVKGDTLWHIAKRYRDNPYLYPELANLSKIRNPNLIYPGDTVTIKEASTK